MSYSEYNNCGILWKNNKKKEEKDRDAQGDATIDGVEYWISGYTKKKDNGEKFVTLRFKRKDAKAVGTKHGPA